MIRKIATLVTTAVLALTAVVVVAAPAAASLATPELSVTVQPWGGDGFRACAYGISAGGSLVSHYSYDLNGTVAPITSSITADGRYFASKASPICFYVWKLENTSGAFTATLTYVSDGEDLANSVVGTGSWDPVQGDHVTSMRTCGDSGC
jgi:hypothetical protein